MTDVQTVITSITQEDEQHVTVRARERNAPSRMVYTCTFPMPAECYGFEVTLVVDLSRTTGDQVRGSVTRFHMSTHDGTAYRGRAEPRLIGIGEMLEQRGPVSNSNPDVQGIGGTADRDVAHSVMLTMIGNGEETTLPVETFSISGTREGGAMVQEFQATCLPEQFSRAFQQITNASFENVRARFVTRVGGSEQVSEAMITNVETDYAPSNNRTTVNLRGRLLPEEEGPRAMRPRAITSTAQARREFGGSSDLADALRYRYGASRRLLADDARLFVDGEEIADNVRVEVPRLTNYPVQASIAEATQREAEHSQTIQQRFEALRGATQTFGLTMREIADNFNNAMTGIDFGEAEARVMAQMVSGSQLTGDELRRAFEGPFTPVEEDEEPQTNFLNFPTIAGIAREVLSEHVGEHLTSALVSTIQDDLSDRGLMLVSSPEQIARGEFIIDYSMDTAVDLGLVDDGDVDEYGQEEDVAGLMIRKVTTNRSFAAVRPRGKRLIQIGDDTDD